MPLSNNRPLDEMPVIARTLSIGGTPTACSTVATTKGYIERAYAFCEGAATGTISVAVSINGGSTVGTVSLTGGANAVGSAEFGINSPSLWVNEGDVITFTPSGGGGATIPGHFYAIIREA